MKRIRSRSKSFSIEDGLAIGAGVLGGMVVNNLVDKAIANQSAAVQESVDKFLPLAKVAAGAGALVAKKMDRRARMAGAGFAAVGVVEAATKFAPQYFKLGTTGETYRVLGIGSPDLSRTPIPVVMGAGGYDDYGMAGEAILGTSNHHEELALI